jgi:hypothetical protein
MFVTEEGNWSSFKAAARVDLTRTLVGITYAHDAVHRDVIVRASKNFVAGTGTTNILLQAPATLEPHIEWAVIGGGDVEVYFYEAPTITAEGTTMTVSRLYLPSAKTTATVAKFGGTVSAKGTLKGEYYNGGGGAGASIRGGSVVHDDAEWVAKVGTWYLMEIIRGTSNKMNVQIEWYEVSPYGGRQ